MATITPSAALSAVSAAPASTAQASAELPGDPRAACEADRLDGYTDRVIESDAPVDDQLAPPTRYIVNSGSPRIHGPSTGSVFCVYGAGSPVMVGGSGGPRKLFFFGPDLVRPAVLPGRGDASIEFSSPGFIDMRFAPNGVTGHLDATVGGGTLITDLGTIRVAGPPLWTIYASGGPDTLHVDPQTIVWGFAGDDLLLGSRSIRGGSGQDSCSAAAQAENCEELLAAPEADDASALLAGSVADGALSVQELGLLASAFVSHTRPSASIALVDRLSVHVCTATLVAERIALTSAHCLFDGSRQRDLFAYAAESGDPTIRVAAAVPHPSFNVFRPMESVNSDIAVLALDRAIDPSVAEPVEIAAATDPPTDATVYIEPWRGPSFPPSDLSIEAIAGDRTGSGACAPRDEHVICAKFDANVCGGDSGAGLIAATAQTLKGILHGGTPDDPLGVCTEPGGQLRFADLSRNRGWINDQIDVLSRPVVPIHSGGHEWGSSRGVSATATGSFFGLRQMVLGRNPGSGVRWSIESIDGGGNPISGGHSGGSSRGVSAIATGDLDGDRFSNDEIIIGRNPGSGMRWTILDGNGNEITSGGHPWGSSRGVSAIATGDLDGDGDDEIIIGRNPGSGMRWTILNGNGTEITSGGHSWGSSRGVSALATGDLDGGHDGDGTDEIIIGRNEGSGVRWLSYDGVEALTDPAIVYGDPKPEPEPDPLARANELVRSGYGDMVGDFGVSVSCLAGNGRVDTNIVNHGDDQATYIVAFANLRPRQRVVDPGDWGRISISGRPDSTHTMVVTRNGDTLLDTTVTVACDKKSDVSDTEVAIVNACRAGFGYLLFQFVNSDAVARPYVIEFSNVPNRSVLVQPHGAGVRAVTGRPAGTHNYLVRSGSTVIEQGAVTTNC